MDNYELILQNHVLNKNIGSEIVHSPLSIVNYNSMSDMILFLITMAVGVGLRILYFGLTVLARSTRLKAMFYIFDVLWCAAAFAGYLAAAVFLHGGEFETYMVLGILAGLGLCSVPFAMFPLKPLPQKERKNKNETGLSSEPTARRKPTAIKIKKNKAQK